MTVTLTRAGRTLFVTVAAAIGLAVVALLPLIADPRPQAREIILVARDMTFFLEGDPTPNPVLHFKAGEMVRVVLRNEERGVTHDFAVKAWNVALEPIRGEGARSVEFQVPDRTGSQDYLCTPHSAMMRGQVLIEP